MYDIILYVLVISLAQNCNKKSPRLIVRQETFDSTVLEKMKKMMHYVIKYIVHVTKLKSADYIGKDIQQAIQTFLNRSLYNGTARWSATNKQHD